MSGQVHPRFVIRHCRTRRDAADEYATALKKYGVAWDGWEAVNAEIVRRWPKGLRYVKDMAWKIVEDGA